ncbi:histidine phosphatase family protein [Motiliproteus sp. MSK22-1]|uniref:histidine phosphatase family protein n=1 Tax=Motiliproteus sp. MSK22-1 TaxID=1897630 RepID=UPI0009771422|nr:histidine phosphatase family protein [Motiliproteus sp. MSK22-1]OMH39742.1 hypothetical protein BGP75_01395 [Motiliproteus sp. MSK22-1]
MSLKLFAIRHAATSWNKEKRLQGRQDVGLSPEGLQSLKDKNIPSLFQQYHWYCSPLKRARQTAENLGIQHYQIEPALIEMDWGTWEGQRLPDLRAQLGDKMRTAEAMGLDLQAPEGESPRQVQQRLLAWLETLQEKEHAGIVCHKGVLRALLSSALDWEMVNDCPVKINWSQGLLFSWNSNQGLKLVDYNISLECSSDS